MKTQENHNHQIYACPMHPEVTGQQGEQCPKCGMDLVAAISESNQHTVELTTSPEIVKAGQPTELRFVFKENGNTVKMEIAHEKLLHLMVVSDDLSWFRHIHPEEQKDGSFKISETFPKSGKYLLFTDYKPVGGTSTLSQSELSVGGPEKSDDVFATMKNVSEVDGYKVTLENSGELQANRSQPLKISVQKDDKLLTERDFQPYLGATAHIVMVGENKDYLHIHPLTDKRFPIYSETQIKKPGLYRIWVEFQIGGKVHTADFTVQVADGPVGKDEQHGNHVH